MLLQYAQAGWTAGCPGRRFAQQQQLQHLQLLQQRLLQQLFFKTTSKG